MHFFIDPSDLPMQTTADRYGAVNLDKYRVTSLFSLPQATEAYAMLSGKLIVQPATENNDLVNIMLKPDSGTKSRTHTVRYILYRGIRKDSLFSGAVLKPKEELHPDHFLQRIWEYFEDMPANMPDLDPGEPQPAEIGFDGMLDASLHVEAIFNESFAGVYPAYVREGDVIGDFASGVIGIETILSHDPTPSAVGDGYIDLGYLRKPFHEIDVTGLYGLARHAKQELLHRYVDPAALVGTLYTSGINARNSQTGSVDRYRAQALYDDILSKFATKNTLYIDIRSDSGYSYNFYQNYGDGQGLNIQVAGGQGSPQATQYGTDGWPILTLDGSSTDYGDTGLYLRTDHNIRPVLFAQYIEIGNVYHRRFTDSVALLDDSTQGWTNRIDLYFPRAEEGSGHANAAQYMTLNYFEPGDIQSTNELDAYYNNAFCAVQLAHPGHTAYPFTFAMQAEPAYADGRLADSAISFAYAGDAGMQWDENQVVFYARSVYTKQRSGIDNMEYVHLAGEGLSLSGDANSGSFLVRDLSLYKMEIWEEIQPDEYQQLSMLNIHHNGSSNEGYEDVLFLGITRSEYEDLLSTTGLDGQHRTYPYLEMVDGQALTDRDGISFHKYRLGLVGIDGDRDWVVSFPATDVHIYSGDGLAFASREFTAATVINETELPLVKDLIRIRNAQRNAGSFQAIEQTGERVFIAKRIFPFIEIELNSASPNEWVQITNKLESEPNSRPDPDGIYGERRITIAQGKVHIYLPKDVPALGFSYLQILLDFLNNEQLSTEILRGEFPDYPTYKLAFDGLAKEVWWLDGHDGVWLKSHRESKSQEWKNAMAAIVQNQWQGVLAPFEQIADFYDYLDEEVKKKGHEIKWQRGAKVLVDVLAEDKKFWFIPIGGGMESGTWAIRNDVETVLNELNLGICDFAIGRFHELIHMYPEPVKGEDAYNYDYVFIVQEQQQVAKPIYDKASAETIAVFQNVVDKRPASGWHGFGSWFFSRATPAFDTFTRPAEVTDDLFRTDLPMLMLYLEQHIPNSDCFKFSDGTLDVSYKDIIRNGDSSNRYKSYEIP